MTSLSQKTVEMSKNVSAYEAADYLGCSYPHLIHLIRKNKLRAQKIRKQWFVDLSDLERAKKTHLVNPRPKDGRTHSNEPKTVFTSNGNESNLNSAADDIEIRLKLSRVKYELINAILVNGSNKTLKQVLEQKVDEMFSTVKNQFKIKSIKV